MTTTYEKHSPTTDALDTLGSLITENEKRDAIHLAVENAVAGQRLRAGDDVAFDADGTAIAVPGPDSPGAVGIVDPFLTQPVGKGQRFWLVVYPRQIHSLRHVWEHPAFPPSGETNVAPVTDEAKFTLTQARGVLRERDSEEARLWLLTFAEDYAINGNDLLDSLKTTDGSWLSVYDNPDNVPLPDEFWDHAETYTGIKYRNRTSQIDCSC